MARLEAEMSYSRVRQSGESQSRIQTKTLPVLLAVLVVVPAFLAVVVAAPAAHAASGQGGKRKGYETAVSPQGTGYCDKYVDAPKTDIVALGPVDDVYACGPNETKGSTPYDSNGDASLECVELSARYLAVLGYPVIDANGGAVVSKYATSALAKRDGVKPILNGDGQAPQVGDVISFAYLSGFSAPNADPGHVALVYKSSVASTGKDKGDGTIEILSENWADTAAITSLAVSDWKVAPIKTYETVGKVLKLVSTPNIEWLPVGSHSPSPPTVSSYGATPSSLGSSGGLVTLSASVASAKTCTFSSTPALSGLNSPVACTNGTVSKEVTVPANTSGASEVYTFDLSVTGTTTVKAKSFTLTVGTVPTLPSLANGAYNTTFDHVDPFPTWKGGTQQDLICGNGLSYDGAACYLEVSASSNSDSFYQNLAYAPASNECYQMTSYFRSASAATFSGVLALWALNGVHDDAGSTNFSVGNQWTKVTVTMNLPNPSAGLAWSSMRGQLYMKTTNALLDWDDVQYFGPYSC